MIKKILVILLLPLILLTGCKKDEEPQKDIFSINLQNIKYVEINKDITITDGTINFQKITYQTNLQILDYTKEEKFTGPSSYLYQIKLDDESILIIDNKTFVYNNHKCILYNQTFDFLNNFTYYLPNEIKQISITEEIKEVKIIKNTTETLYLNQVDKVTNFKNQMNKILYVESLLPSDALITSSYEIKYNNTTIKIINKDYLVINDDVYQIIKENPSFLDQYNQNNTDQKSQNSGWLPWV